MTAADGNYQRIADDVVLGSEVRIGSFVNLYGCAIGDLTMVGPFVEIQRDARVGARCKVSSHTFVCEGVTIEDECFIGHGVTFVNDRYPRATTDDGEPQTAVDWELVPTTVRRRASIGSGATILCGVEIGEGAMVAAGAVVTRDVPPHMLAVGSPARVVAPVRDSADAPAAPTDDSVEDRVPFVDVTAQHREVRDDILAEWERILDSGRFVSGEQVAQFEEAFAAACGVGQCVAVSSGTDALLLAVRALGMRAGDRVVVPANSFIATAAAVTLAGGVPVFVDCDDATSTIDVTQALAALESGAVGVVPVHLYGRPADMDPLVSAARAQGKWVLEDAAQAHLATYRGRLAGGLADAAAFSFYPGKNLGAPGEGGAVTTDDPRLADTLRMLRDHGQREKYRSEIVGYNARMSELIAAALRLKLPRLAASTEARRRVAARYDAILAEHEAIGTIGDPPWARSAQHLYVVSVAHRDAVAATMRADGIDVGLHYPLPIHLQPAYAHLGYGRGDFPVAERKADSLLSLPMFPQLTDAQVERVCASLVKAVEACD